MADAKLNVILSAEAKQLTATMQKAERDVQSFANETKKIPQSLGRVDSGINKTAATFTKANVAVKGSKQNFIELSRVIQDLPFGFTAISNNLTQLIPGVGYLGLAFSALVAILTFSNVGLTAWGVKAKKAGDVAGEAAGKTSELAKEQERFAEAVNKAAQSVIADAKNIQELRDILISTNEATVQLTQNTIKRGLAQFVFDEKNVELQKILNAEIQKSIQLRKTNIPFFGAKEVRQGSRDVANFNRVQQEFRVNLGAQIKAAKEWETLNKTINDGQGAISDLNRLGAGLENFFKEFLSDGKKGADLLDDLLKQVRQWERLINDRGLRIANFEIIPNERRDETIRRAREFIENAVNRRFEFAVNPKLLMEAPVLVQGTKYFAGLRKEAAKLAKDLQSELAAVTRRNPILIEAENLQATQRARGAELANALGVRIEGVNAQTSLLTDMQKAAVNAANSINSVLTPAFDSLFNAIVKGENPIKAFFQSLGQSVSQLIQKLIQAAIQAAILSAIFPGLSSQAGGFGGLFKSLLGFRAEGGPVFANRPYVVGERGPELFIPQGGGRIIPNNEMNSGLAGLQPAAQVVRVEGQIAGRSLRLVNARQSRFENRNV